VFFRFVANLPSFMAVPSSNYVFNRTRCDDGAMFGTRAPRRLKRLHGPPNPIGLSLLNIRIYTN
jgi:hypothetical protein